jgi:membrane-bound lytic murein transglycosylase A
MKKKYFAALILAACLFSGCTTEKGSILQQPALKKLSVSSYPQFQDDLNYEGLKDAIGQSLVYLKRIPADRAFQFGADNYTAAHIIRSLEHFLNFIEKKPTLSALEEFIRSDYLVYQSVGGKDGQVLFTGYFEPILDGSKTESDEYPYPIYGEPEDLSVVDLSLFSPEFKGKKIVGRVEGKTFVPYYDREEIDEEGVLEGKAPVLAYLKDPVALCFLHIQGSGKVVFPDKRIINLKYHSKNGRPYRSIGQKLIDMGKITPAEMSMQKIYEYLHAHPEDISTVLNYNPSYVFFNISHDGPFGAMNVKITPNRSLAIDRSLFPLSVLSFIEVKKPITDNSGKISDWTDCKRFMLNQDTGGAITGPARADIFWGNGAYAELAAGHLKHRGNLYVLVLKP